MLVHCNKGKHRTGCLIGCLRKLQNWSLVPIFNEYARFAGTRVRLLDKQFIEFFAPDISYSRNKAPSWIDINQKQCKMNVNLV
jgi:tyrosine-protein phosphatase SIW14